MTTLIIDLPQAIHVDHQHPDGVRPTRIEPGEREIECAAVRQPGKRVVRRQIEQVCLEAPAM